MGRFYNLKLEKIFFLYALIRERDEKYNTTRICVKDTSSDLTKERKILLSVGTLYVVIELKQGKAWNEKTYSSFKLFRSWNKLGGNSVKLLSCNYLCWIKKKICDLYIYMFSFIKTVINRLVFWSLSGREEKRKEKS